MALAKMKRIFIVGIADDKEGALRFMQEAGVLHIEPSAKLSGDDEKHNTIVAQDARRIGQIYQSMKGYQNRKRTDAPLLADEEVLPRCEKALERLQETRNRIQAIEKVIADLVLWGDFDPDCLDALENENVFVQRFRAERITRSEMHVPDDVFLGIVSERPVLHFFTISLDKPVELSWATALRRPEIGLEKAKRELNDLKETESAIIEDLYVLAHHTDVLKGRYLEALNEANFSECAGTLHSEEMLFGLQGWIPEDVEKEFLNRLETSRLALTVRTRDPVDSETPPTMFKNNWFFKRTEPLLELYGLPPYRELDPSYFFAPFMVLFFGICLGDAGYGAVFLAASIWIRKRFGHLSPTLPAVMRLCEVFSVSAIVVGLITGSVFGHWALTRDLILVDIDKDHGDPMILFYASLGLGLMHLSISYAMGIFQSYSLYERFQKLGILCVLWGGSTLIVRHVWFSKPGMVINDWLYYGGLGILVIGLLLTLVFASDSRKIVTRLGLGLWNIYGLTGLVGDLLSYARLFGLGIATTAIASVMNDLAGMVYDATGAVIGSVLGFLILIVGHTFNLLLSVLGSTVHSARLHFVEAFKSFFNGGGVEYKPFKIKRG